MKKTLIAIAIAMFASAASADLIGSAHNLTDATADQACKFCHAPHGGNAAFGTVALWNRATPAAAYTGYSTATVPGVTMSNNTKACLSCHDGSTTVGQVYNNGTVADYKTAYAITGLANLGVTLVNDHPVDITYPTKTGYVAAPPATLPLSGGNVMCTTCHDPHDNGGFPFMLRADPTASAICSACHVK
jgi:predicted CXXCH cytochrome family protein